MKYVDLSEPEKIIKIEINEYLCRKLVNYVCNSGNIIRHERYTESWETLGYILTERTGRKDFEWKSACLHRCDPLDFSRYDARILPTEDEWNALRNITPTFTQMVAWIARKYPNDVLSATRGNIYRNLAPLEHSDYEERDI